MRKHLLLILLLISAIPAMSAQQTEPCNPALPSRLSKGDPGKVAEGTPNRLREQPGLTGEIIGAIPSGMDFDVTDGPVCSDGIIWWHIIYVDGKIIGGWTAEGADGEYFLEPPTVQVPIAKDNIGQIARYGSFIPEDPIRHLTFTSRVNLGVISAKLFRGWYPTDPFSPFNTATYSSSGALVYGSPDRVFVTAEGKVIVVTFDTDHVKVNVINAGSGFNLPVSGVLGAALHPTGNLLVTFDVNTLTVWDLLARNVRFTSDYEDLSDVVFSPDGQYLGVAYVINIDMISTSDWATIGKFQYDTVVQLYDQRITISPDNRHLAAVGNTNSDPGISAQGVCFLEPLSLDTTSTNLFFQTRHPGERLTSLSRPIFTTDSSSALVVESYEDDTSTVRIYDVQTMTSVGSFDADGGDTIIVNPDGTLFAVYAAEDNNREVTLWGVP